MNFNKQISLDVSDHPDSVRASEIFARCLRERCPAEILVNQSGGYPIEITLSQDIPGEAFAIEDATAGLRVTAGCGLGLIHGLGKLLRNATCSDLGYAPGAWRGLSTPVLPVRGIYFATHFHNWYHVAPVEEIQRYVEELALWGTNTLCVWFDLHHFNGIHDPMALAMLERLNAVLGAAQRVGMKTAAIFLANEAYANSPEEMRADWTAGHNGYHKEPGGHYHVELCPSKPGALELIMRWAEERLEAFKAVGLDYICIWPYDQGGCTCAECTPWGANGFLRCAEPLARLYKHHFPQGKVILSTWYFDHFISREWDQLANLFAQKPDWVDILLADDYGDRFPPFLGEHGVPGNLPVVGFPEISMYRCLPWGGYGANPIPDHFQKLWDQCKHLVAGGFPYSEGIFEDINKAIYAQFYWDPSRTAWDTVSEYLHYEFGTAAVEPLKKAIEILENNLPRSAEAKRIDVDNLNEAETAWNWVREADRSMEPQRKQLWRWRMLYRRAQIDAELVRTRGKLEGYTLREAFVEITQISHAANSLETWVRPPVMGWE